MKQRRRLRGVITVLIISGLSTTIPPAGPANAQSVSPSGSYDVALVSTTAEAGEAQRANPTQVNRADPTAVVTEQTNAETYQQAQWAIWGIYLVYAKCIEAGVTASALPVVQDWYCEKVPMYIPPYVDGWALWILSTIVPGPNTAMGLQPTVLSQLER
jgi:hypothetical protein